MHILTLYILSLGKRLFMGTEAYTFAKEKQAKNGCMVNGVHCNYCTDVKLNCYTDEQIATEETIQQ